MNNKFLLLGLSAAFLGVGLTSCTEEFPLNLGFETVKGSGKVITESRNVSGFDAISLSGFGEIDLVIGSSESLVIEIDDNLMQYIETVVEDNSLVIRFTRDARTKNLKPTDKIKYHITAIDLNSVSISGAGSLSAESLEVNVFEIGISGAGDIDISNLMADSLVIKLSGAGDIDLAGEVGQQNISISGAGNYNAADLKSMTAVVNISGAGSGTLWATETLNVNLSGVGNLNYYGSPTITESISGIGSLKSKGEK